MSGAGVCAMGAENQFIVDGAWDFLARYKIQATGMDAATCVLGLLIMGGLYNTSDQPGNGLPTITTPPAPQNVQATPQTSSSILLSWDKVPAAFDYVVEKKENGAFVPADTINRNVTTSVIPLLEPMNEYTFRVAAINTKGSTASEPVSVTTPGPSSGEMVLAINVGGSAHVGSDGVYYLADQYFTEGRPNPRGIAIEGTEDDEVYSSERWGVFSYNIPLDAGDYVVTLMFAEGFHSAVNKRIFDVSIEGESTADMKGIDIVALAGGPRTAVDLEFEVSSTGPTLDMQFTRLKDNASLSGIRVRRSGTVSARRNEAPTSGLSVTPNIAVSAHPQKGLMVHFSDSEMSTAQLSVYSMQGKLLLHTALTAGKAHWIRDRSVANAPIVYHVKHRGRTLSSGLVCSAGKK
jgi:hypothetical protein